MIIPRTRRFQLFLLCLFCSSISRLDAFAISELKTKEMARSPFLLQAVSPSSPTTEISANINANTGWGVAFLHLTGCVVSAFALCMYEDYDCANLKPNRYLQPHAVRGMGEGYNERMEDWRGGNVLVNTKDDISLINILNYNEIGDRHRLERVPNWDNPVNEADVRGAVHNVFSALAAVDKLKVAAEDYGWDEMRAIIRQPALTTKLEQSCSMLRRASFALSDEARSTIGFDWGSCAWRHCGAEADAQESLAELYNLVGVLEPFECKFVLDIIERSLRDVLAVVPVKYYDQALVTYQPYLIRDAEDVDGESKLDMEYLNAINEFRNPQWEDE
eukprot:CAMPEP_0119014230 /NCGR_PEP_ID=MMETSP1176-20130426/9426_1 /TAXON_ID=265551 /ORGANISM="Synedropsis recta cf, Strain CCMP1620" /LENGTH=331 /DNA_ID=CAMNT_0006967383 /DNA_START=81 /DNA_END=1076 /DNA_ORIENTATION=+